MRKVSSPARRALHLVLSAAFGLAFNAVSPAPYAHAAYNYPVTWSDLSDLDLKSVFQSQYASRGNLFEPIVTDNQIELALRDSDNLVGPAFRVPPELRNSVEFWLRIYTQYTTQHVVIFDSRHPEIVYDVLDFRDLSQTSRNAVVYEILMKRKIKKEMASFRRAFAELDRAERRAGGRRHVDASRLSPHAQKILAAVAKSKHKHRFGEFARNLRTQTGQRDNVIKGLLAAETFFPKMEKLFTDVGVPPELSRLPLVESSFDLKAKSRLGAAGVWQFMAEPGKALSLKIDHGHQLDERLNPLKATVAAARMLKQSNHIFGNWALTITSYNHGLRGLLKYKHTDDEDFAAVSRLFLPCRNGHHSGLAWAGRNYYAEFLAVLHAEHYRQLFYGEPPTSGQRNFTTRHISESKTGFELAAEQGISVQEFQALNRDIENLHRKLPRGYVVIVPGERDDFEALLEKPSRVRGGTRLAARARPKLVSETLDTGVSSRGLPTESQSAGATGEPLSKDR